MYEVTRLLGIMTYWNWMVQCKNPACATQIELLRPNFTVEVGDPIWYPKVDFRMLLLCPVCGFVYAYNGVEFRAAQLPNAAQYLSRTSSLSSVVFQCAEDNCAVLTTMYTHGEDQQDPGEVVKKMERGRISIECPSGHPLKLPAPDKWKVNVPTSFPHEPPFRFPRRRTSS